MEKNPNEQKLVSEILAKFREARTAKAEEEKKWRTQEDYYQGNQWKSKKAYDGQLQPVTNICFSIVESMVPQLTDSRPQIVCLPQEPGDEQGAEILSKIIEYIWDRADMDYKLQMGERTRLKHGMSIFKVFWNPELMRGLGDVDIIQVPLDQFFISPRAKSVQDSEYVIYATQKTTDYIKKRYGKEIKSDTKYNEIAVFDQDEDDGPSKANKNVLLIEYWTKDNGEIRLVTVAGDTILRDERSFYKSGLYPFVAIPAFPTEKKFWAMGIVQHLLDPQRIVNLLDQQILDNARLGGNGTIYRGAGSGIDKRQLTNLPFKVVDVNGDINQIKVEGGIPLPAFIPNHLVTKKKDAEMVSGIHDVMQGKTPGSVTAASAIMALQESANQRIRLLGRTLEAGLKDMGELIIHLIKEFYEEERTIRILGDNYQVEFVPFKNTQLMRVQTFQSADGSVEEIMVDPDFDVRVEVGSSMQMSRAFLYEQAKELFGMGVIDDKALLEAVKFPKAEEVLERKQQVQQQMEMMQQMQQAPPPIPGM